MYFDEQNVDPDQYKGPLGTSASVVSGVSALAAVSSEKLNVRIAFQFSFTFTAIKCKYQAILHVCDGSLNWIKCLYGPLLYQVFLNIMHRIMSSVL